MQATGDPAEEMTMFCRFVKYSITCPSGHTEIRNEVIVEPGRIGAAHEVIRQRFICSHCRTGSSTRIAAKFGS